MPRDRWMAGHERRLAPGRPRVAGPEAVRIRLLGGFEVSVGSRVIEEGGWRLRKAGILVRLLALSPGHRLHKERAMDLLWPELGPEAAANNLHRTLHVARGTLEPSATSLYLRLQDEQLSLCPEGPLWVDVEAFEEAAATARRAHAPAAYRAVIELYTGELLPGDRHEAWAEDRREQLWRLRLELLVELAGLYEQRGEFEAGIEALGGLAAGEPAEEEAHLGLMRLYALSGRRAEAVRQYERLERALARELGDTPSEAARRLNEEIGAGRFSPDRLRGRPREEPSDRHNLPEARGSFVGRRRELVEVRRSLAMTALLTLTGAGGSGKTRLALEAARELVGTYPDGVWLVELAPFSDPALVGRAVAEVVGAREEPGRTLEAVIVETLRNKRTLLLLDNCEHLVEAAARLADTLTCYCPGLKILATSREVLNVGGETVWQVPPLSVPDGRPSVGELERSEAARLFVDRAARRAPGFALSAENARAVADICTKLDGIPLAIELAAARVGTLSAGQISERLGDSLRLLTTGDRTAALRQRTLRGALDWSYDLLVEGERALFRRLSVFAGGFTLDAAEAVGSDGGGGQDDVLDLISRLVDKSLVLVTGRGGEARYRLLEPVRQYASGKLESGVEEKAVRQSHALFFLDLAERAEPELSGTGQAAWLDRLEGELDNLRAALGWFRESGQRQPHLRLAGALCRFCYLHGHYEEGLGWLDGALATGDDAPPSARAKALLGAGVLALLQCEYDRARGRLEEALAIYRALGDERGVASASQTLGSIARERGDYARAEALHEESLAIWRELGDEAGEARSLNYLAYVAWLQENHERAKELCEETLVRFRILGDNEVIAWALISQGSSAHYAGDLRRARALLEESLALSHEVGYKEGVAWSLNQLGVLAYREGEHRRATELLGESLEIHRNLGDRWRAASVLEALAESLCARGRLEPAARLFGAAKAVRESISVPVPLCERADYEESISATRAGMGEAAFEAAWVEGRAMTPEQAMEHASEEPPLPTAPESRETPVEPPPALTRREQEVALLIARGLTNRQIAGELTISERTVTTHVAHILNKLGATSRAQVAAWMVEQRLLPEVGPG